MLFSKQTPAAGGDAFAQFDAAWCYNGNGYIFNDTGTSLDVRIGDSGSVQTVAAGKTLPIALVFSMAELYVRRTDQSPTQVTVEATVGLNAGAQGLDSDLTALAGLSTTGLVARTGAGTAATRTITGTTNQVIVSNGDGVAGNPSLSLPQSIATTNTPLFAGVGVNGAAASFRLLQFYTGGVRRINVGTDGAGEIGANAGSNFQINRFDDAGNSLGVAIFIQRSTGNVGIGVSGPTSQLHTTGTVRFAGFGAGALVTDSSGNVTASSDASLKTVTGSFTRGLDDVLKLTPRTYHWNEKSGMNTEDENVGFIAQEVLGAVPEAVGQYRTTEMEIDGKKTKKREKSELLTLSDRPLIAALVNAVKELKADNDALRARVSALENAGTP